MILTQADQRLIEAQLREEERQDDLELFHRGHCDSVRAQLQAAVELLEERTGQDPGRAIAARVARNRRRAGGNP